MVYVPTTLYVSGSLVVPLIVVPPHPSEAVGTVDTVTLHSPVTSGRFVTSGAGTPVS